MNPLDARNAEIVRQRDAGLSPEEVRQSLGVTQGIVNKVYAEALERRRRHEQARRNALLLKWERHAPA